MDNQEEKNTEDNLKRSESAKDSNEHDHPLHCKYKEEKKDLGFLEGIKGELIPILIGLAAFPFLVETLINEIESFLLVKESTGIILFNVLYFIIPTIVVFGWLVWINSHQGLKALYFTPVSSLKKILIVLISCLLFFLAVIAFFYLSNLWFFLFSIVAFILIIGYLALVHGNYHSIGDQKTDELYHQAKKQFQFATTALIVLIFIYFTFHIFSTSDKRYELNFKESLPFIEKILVSASDRARLKSWDEFIDSIPNSIPSFPHVDAEDSIQLEELKKVVSSVDDAAYSNSIYKKLRDKNEQQNQDLSNARKKIEELAKQIKSNMEQLLHVDEKKGGDIENKIHWLKNDSISWRKKENDALNRKATTLKEFIKYHQKQLLHSYQQSTKQWLIISQFKGLLLFTLLILFLIVIWYDAYTLRLTSTTEEFSEINTARISIYLIFLLTIPIFKPIDEKAIDLDKPYISISRDEESETSSHKSHEPIDQSDLRRLIEQTKADLLERSDSLDSAIKKVDRYQRHFLKKERNTPTKSYDNENLGVLHK